MRFQSWDMGSGPCHPGKSRPPGDISRLLRGHILKQSFFQLVTVPAGIAVNAKDRLTRSNDKYVLVDGSVIAINWDNLVSSKLLALLNKKADGTNVAGFLDAYWTGSTFGGIAYNGFTCNDWTDASYNYRGIFTKIEDQYLETPNSIYWSNSCAVPYRLVCIQQ